MLVDWDTHALRYTGNGTQWGAQEPWSRVLGELGTHKVGVLEEWDTHAVGCLEG